MITMNPMTTPGKASGKVSIAVNRARPRNRLRLRNTPATPETIRVATVVAPASSTVAIRLRR
jgi:hypothetical protein